MTEARKQRRKRQPPVSLSPLDPEDALAGLLKVKPEEKDDGPMPKFKVGDRVMIPVEEEHVEERFRGAEGTVLEVRPGTGFRGKRPDDQGRLSEWSTPHLYLIDFGSHLGQYELQEGLLMLETPA